jgi:DNA-binding winged helix-turn-helix (wHTH) protein/tetratricopeptide (TPR) repeat protein
MATQWCFGPFRFDAENACVWRGTQMISLTPKAMAILQHLVEHAGRLVTKEALLEAIWPKTAVSDGVLKVRMDEIRKALSDSAKQPQFIATVHRRGYRFIADIAEADPSQAPHEVTGGIQAATDLAVPRPQHRSPMPRYFVGRTVALGQLQGWLAQALDGERHLVFVTGEPGIGKTAAVEAFLAQAAADPRLLIARGQCIKYYGTGEAYLPVLEAVSRLCRGPAGERLVALLRREAPLWLVQLPGLLRAADREALQRELLGATRERMLREMVQALEALTAQTPLLLVLEDLHWSDPATLDLLASLARRQEPAQLLVIGTYRPVEVIVRRHPLRAMQQELQLHGHCQELPLEALTEAEVAAYLTTRYPGSERVAELPRWVYQRTEGHPLFMATVMEDIVAQGMLVEREGQWTLGAVVEALEDRVPESIRQMLEQQLERLPEAEQRILEAGSVAGMEFPVAAVAAALTDEVAPIEERCEGLARRQQFLQPAGLVEWPDGTVTSCFGFIHALHQHVVYQRVSAARRVQLHRRIGRHMAEAYGSHAGQIAAELAVHFERGRDACPAIAYLQQAARNAARRYAHREAVDYLRRAFNTVALLPETERPSRSLEVLEQLGLAHRAMGNLPAAAAGFEGLAAYARDQGDIDREAKALLYLASALFWNDRQRGVMVADQASQLIPSIKDELLRVHTRSYCGFWRLEWCGWRGEDARACAEAIAAARQAGDRALLSLHVGRYAYFQCLQSDYQAACRTAEEGLQLALEVGNAYEYLLCQCYRARALLHLGHWGEMLGVLGDALQMAQKNEHHPWTVLLQLETTWLYIQACAFERVRELCEKGAQRAQEVQYGHTLLLSRILLGLAHLGLEQYERAFDCFSEVRHQGRGEGSMLTWLLQLLLCHGLSEYWLAQGAIGQARQEAEWLCALAAGPGERTYLALGRRTLTAIALAERRWDQAEATLSQALSVLEGAEAPLAAWRVYATAAQLHQQRGRRGEAAHYWERSATILHRLADSLEDAAELRQSLLAHPPVQAIFRCAAGDPSAINRYGQRW